MANESQATKILVVEDEMLISREIQCVLTQLGYGVSGVASSGAEALELAASGSTDLVLMDIQISGDVDGVETALEIYRRFQIPVVYLTGHSDPVTFERAKGTEPFGYLLKPFGKADLRAAIAIALASHRKQLRLEEKEKWFGDLFRRLGDVASHAEAAERERAEDYFRSVVEAVPNALIKIGPKGQIGFLNSYAAKLFGYDSRELLGQSFEVLVPRYFRDIATSRRDSLISVSPERGSTIRWDLFGVRKDGKEISLEIAADTFHGPDGRCVLASIVDITERKLTQETLERSLHENQALLQEVHHRVRNNLQLVCSLLGTHANMMENEAAIAKLQDSERRVMSIAMVHEQLYRQNEMSSVDLAEYVRDLESYLFPSYASSSAIACRLEISPVKLPIEQAIPCGLILNELVTNALKHAYAEGAGEILVRLSLTGDEVSITVSDQGVGMPAGFDWTAPKTFGLKLVQLVVNQLDGRLEIGTAPGASFTISFAKQPFDAAFSPQ